MRNLLVETRVLLSLVPDIVDSMMGELSISGSSGIRAYPTRVNLCSVIQSLRCNSSRLLPVVRPGPVCIFVIRQDRIPFPRPDEADVMNQLVAFEITHGQSKDCIEFGPIVWDFGNLVNISVLKAMQTNTTVRSLVLDLDIIEESHLTAIEAALLKNDTLQSFSVWADDAIRCPFEAVRAAFEQILKRNMCLRKLFIGPNVPFENLSDGPDLFFHDEAGGLLPDPFIEYELRSSDHWHERWQVDLGRTVNEAIKRNCQAFAVAEALGRVSRSSMLCYPNFGDIGFRRQLLLFFLQEGCQPPRMMLSVAKALPKY